MKLGAVLAVFFLCVLSACKNLTQEEKLEAFIVELDQAFSKVQANDYEGFEVAFDKASDLQKEIFTPYDMPARSLETYRGGKCDGAAIKGYYYSLLPISTYAEPLFRDGDIPVDIKADIRDMINREAAHIDRSWLKQYRDCNRYIPGYRDRILAVQEYIRQDLRALFEERAGPDAHEEINTQQRGRLLDDLENWSSLSKDRKRYFTHGDNEVERCIEAFVADDAPSPDVASINDVARLCQQGLEK